MTSKANISFWF